MSKRPDVKTETTESDQESNWNVFLSELESRVGQFQFQIFGSHLDYSRPDNTTLEILVPRNFHKEWLQEKQQNEFYNSVERAYGEEIDVIITVTESTTDSSSSSDKNNLNKTKNNINESKRFPFAESNDFNPDHTFENFIVGDCNEYAYSAAKAISEDPANSFNPLFVYGGVGLGKTHLLNAIAHQVKTNWDQANVKCINAEQFTNEIINAIRESNTKDFKYNYRNVDMFLVDDVQFLAKTDAAQEEFYHTFNELYEKGKGTVFCSDSPPEEISKIEERLRSRFGMGLTVDIQPPGYETRMAILQKKAESEDLTIPDEVIHYIADNIQDNVRKLESCLTRLGMKASLSETPITVEMAQNELDDLISASGTGTDRVVTIDEIQSIIAEHFDLSISDLTSKKRTRAIAEPRQLAMFLARKQTNASYSDIGDMFGGRDHSTVMHAQEKIESLLDEEPDSEICSHLRTLREKIQAGPDQ
ncbi:MAG: chromosomal replication initiator protein DnaA [bacterium]